MCPSGKQPAEPVPTRCWPCPAGTRKAAGHATCTFCPAGSEPASSNYTACQLCASGHRSSEETAGLCLACGRGLQPTDLQFQHTMAGAARCSECVHGQYSDFDPRLQVSLYIDPPAHRLRLACASPVFSCTLMHSSPVSSPHCPQVSHRCLACPEFMTTPAPGAEDVSNCACVAGQYDTVSHGIIWGHPQGFNDSTARDLMQASAGSIARGLRCSRCPDGETTRGELFVTCNSPAEVLAAAARNGSSSTGLSPVVIAAGYAELPDSITVTIVAANSTDGQSGSGVTFRHFFACPYGAKSCLAVGLGGGSRHHHNGTEHRAAINCAHGYTDLLCGACIDGWSQTQTGCVECTDLDGPTLAIMVAFVVVLAGLTVWGMSACDNSESFAAVILWAGVLQRLRPRMT